MAQPSLAPAGSSSYASDTMHVGDGTWDATQDTFLLPNIQGLNFNTMRYNGRREGTPRTYNERRLTTYRHGQPLPRNEWIYIPRHGAWSPSRNHIPHHRPDSYLDGQLLSSQRSTSSSSTHRPSGAYGPSHYGNIRSRVLPGGTGKKLDKSTSCHRLDHLLVGTRPGYWRLAHQEDREGQDTILHPSQVDGKSYTYDLLLCLLFLITRSSTNGSAEASHCWLSHKYPSASHYMGLQLHCSSSTLYG